MWHLHYTRCNIYATMTGFFRNTDWIFLCYLYWLYSHDSVIRAFVKMACTSWRHWHQKRPVFMRHILLTILLTLKHELRNKIWIHLGQWWWAIVNTVMGLQVLWKAENFLISWMTITFPRMTIVHEVNIFNYIYTKIK